MYMIQEIVPNLYTEFKNPRCSSSLEIFDDKFY